MGDQLVQFYKEAEYLGGIRARMKLAAFTQIPSAEAAATMDTPAKIDAFHKGMAALAGEIHAGDDEEPAIQAKIAGEKPEVTIERLRRNAEAMVDLMSQRALFLGNVAKTNARLTEALTGTLQVQRASVWFYDEHRTLIRCADLFDTTTQQHTAGLALMAKDFAPYFAALETERTIAAHDAHRDPRTSVFSQPYLGPLGITSMLDVPIWVEGRMIGVVCNEHVGSPRTWIADEENFAFVAASLAALTIDMDRARSVRR